MEQEALDRVGTVFALFDVNGNGQLDSDDFELMTERVVAAVPEAGAAKKAALAASLEQYWETLRTELDADRDGVVSLEEFTSCVLSPERFGPVIDEFARAITALSDPDGDGLVEHSDFTAVMLAIGFERANVDALFESLAVSGSDRVGVPAWIEAINDYYRPDKAGISGDLLVPTPST